MDSRYLPTTQSLLQDGDLDLTQQASASPAVAPTTSGTVPADTEQDGVLLTRTSWGRRLSCCRFAVGGPRAWWSSCC
jgi:hypothetical protein